MGVRSALVRVAVAMFIATLALPAFPSTATANEHKREATVDRALLAAARADPQALFRVIVTARADRGDYKKDEHVKRATAAVKKAHGRADHALGVVGGASATVSGVGLLKIARDEDVAAVVADQTFSVSFDPVAAAAAEGSAGILEVGAPQAWRDSGVTGRGVTVAVVDSGVAAHPDLGARLIGAIDFTSAAPTLSPVALGDPGGHGSHVAGLVAGDGTASGGLYTGVAPEANIIDVRVISGTGSTDLGTVLRGLQW